MENRKKKQNIGKELTKLNLISGLGFTIIANLIVGYILGAFLDNIFTTGRIFKIIFIVLGTLSGVYNGIRYILKEMERYDKIDRDYK
ncbi:AtpZ/AtpI family protein [Fervidobacterium sp.]